jgi:hypothetical protein
MHVEALASSGAPPFRAIPTLSSAFHQWVLAGEATGLSKLADRGPAGGQRIPPVLVEPERQLRLSPAGGAKPRGRRNAVADYVPVDCFGAADAITEAEIARPNKTAGEHQRSGIQGHQASRGERYARRQFQ